MKHILFLFVTFLTLHTTAQTKARSAVKARTATPAGTTFQAPIIIKTGGKYTGNYKSTDSNTPAVWIWTSEPVEIVGCIIESAGIGIKFEGSGQATIHNNIISGTTPTGNEMWGRAVYCYQPQSAEVYSNTIEHTGGGIMIDGASSSGTRKIKILYNIMRNMDKRKADLTQGYEHRSGIQITNNICPDADIKYNQIINTQDSSWMEDGISIMNSGGVVSNPLEVANNYIDGSYPYPSHSITTFTGSGITVECSGGITQFDKMSQYVNAYSNQVIRAGNACMNIASGHNVHYYNNTMISSGKFPDGFASNVFWGGCAIWNGVNAPVENSLDNYIKGNTIGYVRPEFSTPLPGRQDWVVVAGSPISVQPGDNTSLPNPITKATEDAEYPKWLKKLSDSGIVIGNSDVIIVPPPVDTTGAITLKFGETMQGKVLIKNILGELLPLATDFKDLTLTADPLTILQIDQQLGDLKSFSIKGIKPGSANLYVTVVSNGGVRMSKTIKIVVTADLSEATSFEVILPYKP